MIRSTVEPLNPEPCAASTCTAAFPAFLNSHPLPGRHVSGEWIDSPLRWLSQQPESLKAASKCVNFTTKTNYLYTGQKVRVNDSHISDTFKEILRLIQDGKLVVSNHGYDELAEDSLTVREILAGVSVAVVIEDYPVYPKGPSILVLQRDAYGKPIHVVWGIPKGSPSTAVLVTAYRPIPSLWSADFLRRNP